MNDAPEKIANDPKTGMFCNICGKQITEKRGFTHKYVSIGNAYVCDNPECIKTYKENRVNKEVFEGYCSGCGEKMEVDFSVIPVKSTHNHRIYKLHMSNFKTPEEATPVS